MRRYALTLAIACIAHSAQAISSQPSLQRVFAQFTVIVGPEEAETGTWFTVEWPSGQVSQFLVPEVYDVERLTSELSVYQTARLVIRSRANLVLVDPGTGTVIDRFLTLGTGASPDGRYLAIQRFLPNGVTFADSVYTVYDLERSPAQNRPGAMGTSAAGWVVYPPSNVLTQSYSGALQKADAHLLLSPLEWIGSNRLAFVDYSHAVVKLVLVDVGAGIDHPKKSETALDLPSLLALNTNAADAAALRVKAIHAVAVSRSVISIRLTFEPASFLRSPELVVDAAAPR